MRSKSVPQPHRRPMRVFVDSNSPDFFHGPHAVEAWQNGKPLGGCRLLDKEAGLARVEVKGDSGATIVRELKVLLSLAPVDS
ncbi:hypothetical protein [Bosea psychrotolerans]|nr:hypothetical protein [Bosea psychrotolerans]